MARVDPDQNENMSRFDFCISGHTPDSIPMGRLGEYMVELNGLIGKETLVHFTGIEKGSTIIGSRVDYKDVPKVEGRLQLAGRANAPSDINRHYKNINEFLIKDKAHATLRHDSKIIEFPGCNIPIVKQIGPIREFGILDGEITRVGGKDETLHVLLLDADDRLYSLATKNRDLAKQMANHLFELVRVTGMGVWRRNREKRWVLEKFTIEEFKPLEERTLIEAVTELRAIEGSGWQNMEDPLAVWHELRGN